MNQSTAPAATVDFSTIGNKLAVRLDILSLMSGRDKAELFRALAADSGMIDAMLEKPGQSAAITFQAAYNNLWNK